MAEEDAKRTTLREKLDKLQARWSLFLAVGNGAAMTALGSKLLESLFGVNPDTDKVDHSALLAFCFPPLFFFSLGLLAAASIPLFELIATNNRLRSLGGTGEKAASGDDAYWDKLTNWLPEIAAAVCFMAGLGFGVVPLAILYLHLPH